MDKGDGNGWPWLYYYCPERWSALLDDNNTGLGVYQPESASFASGFFGGDGLKGVGGAKDGQTGYIAPLSKMILDYNIERTYRAKTAGIRTHFLVALGSALFMILSGEFQAGDHAAPVRIQPDKNLHGLAAVHRGRHAPGRIVAELEVTESHGRA